MPTSVCQADNAIPISQRAICCMYKYTVLEKVNTLIKREDHGNLKKETCFFIFIVCSRVKSKPSYYTWAILLSSSRKKEIEEHNWKFKGVFGRGFLEGRGGKGLLQYSSCIDRGEG